MTESVTPPDPPLVDPETGETPPLSPQARALGAALKETLDYMTEVQHAPRYDAVFFEGTAWLDSLAESDEWVEYEGALVVHMESDDAP